MPPASDRIVMGGIGIGNMGSGDQGAFLGRSDVQYVAVCDVRRRVNASRPRTGSTSSTRTTTARPTSISANCWPAHDIDAVHVATPDHWHAIMVIEACRTGKDVYCQKPETRTLREGPLMVEAARRYGRVVSGGSQRGAGRLSRHASTSAGAASWARSSRSTSTSARSRKPCNLPAEPVPAGHRLGHVARPGSLGPLQHERCDGNFGTEAAAVGGRTATIPAAA